VKLVYNLTIVAALWLVVVFSTVPTTTADEDPPITLGDVILRLESLEAWRLTVEQSATPVLVETENSTSADIKRPILEVSSSDFCVPCRKFKEDIEGKQLPIEIKWIRWAGAPNKIPAFRYTNKTGIEKIKVGYASGEWKTILADMGFSE